MDKKPYKVPTINFEKAADALIQLGEVSREAARIVAQTLSGDAPIPTGERVLQHGPDDHGLDADRER